MLVTHIAQLAGTTVAGLFLSPFGMSFFGIFGFFVLFGPIAFILLVANLFGGRSRSHGDPSGLGIVVGLAMIFFIAVAISAAVQ